MDLVSLSNRIRKAKNTFLNMFDNHESDVLLVLEIRVRLDGEKLGFK